MSPGPLRGEDVRKLRSSRRRWPEEVSRDATGKQRFKVNEDSARPRGWLGRRDSLHPGAEWPGGCSWKGQAPQGGMQDQ